MRQEINRGASAGDPSADDLRTGALKINENFIELYSQLDGLMTPLNIVNIGPNYSIEEGCVVRIAGIEYTAGEYGFTILDASEGFQRIDILVASASGFSYIPGEESEWAVTAPAIPSGSFLVKEYYIDSDSVTGGPDPVIGNPYIEKNQFNEIGSSSGVFYLNEKTNYIINDPAIEEMPGLILPDDIDQGLYPGKLFMWTNKLASPVTFIDDDPTVDIPNMLGGANLILPPGGVVLLKWGTMGYDVNGALELIAINFGVTGSELSSAVDAVNSVMKSQKTITGNTTLDDTYHLGLVKVKGTATITVPAGLTANFSCVFDCWAGATATFAEGLGVDIIETALTLLPNKMATLYKDGSTENFKLKGETS